MKNEKPLVTAKRIKIPILEGTKIYITFCFFIIFVISVTPLVNLVLKNVFYDYIHIGKYFYILCVALFLLSFLKIIVIVTKNNIHNKKPEDCIVESLYDLYIYDKKVYHIQKADIVSFTFVPKYPNYDPLDKNLCVGNHIIKYKLNNKIVKKFLTLLTKFKFLIKNGESMETFNYQIFTVGYRQMLKDTYTFILLSPNGKEIYRDYILVNDTTNIQLLITKKLEKFLTKQSLGKFKFEIFFVGQEWKPCVMITLGDEVICEELKPNEQNLSKISDLINNMLNENFSYNGYTIINFNKFGKNSEQKNLCAYKQKSNGKYDCIYAYNLESLKEKLNYK